jgi:starvation-inducible DNA-binding protein
VLKDVWEAAKHAAEAGDDGTKGLLVSGVSRTHGMQVWFLVEHLVDTPLVRAQ